MLKVKTKFRCIITLYMAVPIGAILLYTKDTTLFADHDFQGALGIGIALCILMGLCNPLLLGLKWLFLSQLTRVSMICTKIKTGRYAYFTLPNQPKDNTDENEMQALMRDMNWMTRQIESREAELENRVARRTRALKDSNEALAAARDEAAASARAKAEFLATMTHEIRTPMNAIIGMSSLAAKQNRDQNIDEHLKIIHNASSTLLGIINDILDFSKIDAGKLKLEKIPFQIRALFEEIADMFKGQLKEDRVELILDIAPGIPRTILGDPLRLRQVLTNLISNAVKFTREGEICVTAAMGGGDEHGNAITFSVRDTGAGIDPGVLESLFTPFTQADGSITRKFGGTGLGLAISGKLVSLMGSEIRVQSRKGHGSVFSFTLCVDLDPGLDTPGPVLPFHALNRQVFTAIQNPTAEKIIHRFIEDFGLCPQKSLTLENQKKRPALALMDTALPPSVVSGHLAALDRLSQDSPLPIVAIGALAGKDKGRPPAWAARFIPKPVKQSLLFDTLMEIFENQGRPYPTGEPEEIRPPAPAAHSRARGTVQDRDIRILVVEDNKINQKVALEIFRSAGIRPRFADCGSQALEMVARDKFDAVLMDVQMPGMDGYQATRAIRRMETGAHLPIIAMTANAGEDDRENGRQAGMTAYITKPVDPDTLFSTLGHCLGLKIGCPGPDQDKPVPTEEFPGIDTARALKRLNNNRTILKELILDFVRDHGKAHDRLENLIREQDVQGLIALAHKLKGIAANLSAVELTLCFTRLEGAGRKAASQNRGPDPALDMAKLSPWLDRISKSMARLAASTPATAGETHASDSGAVPPAPARDLPEDILEQIGELGRLIQENSLTAKAFSRDLAARLTHTPLGKRAGQLDTRIKRYEFQAARQIFEQLEDEIRLHINSPANNENNSL